MKKFIIRILLLAIFGGAVFYVGWIQVLLPPGSHAVIHTKTGGFDAHTTPSGVFAWRWEKLLPTNMTIYPFQITPIVVETPPVEGALPSGEIYASVMDGQPDFTYSISFSMTVALKPETLPKLVAEEGLTPDTVVAWLQERTREAGAQLAHQIVADPIQYIEGSTADRLERAVRAALPEIEVSDIATISLKVPDRDLYFAARAKYLELARAHQEREVSVMTNEAATLRVLEEYGRLLEEYPVLLEYLYLQELKGEKIEGLDLDLKDILTRE